MNCELNSCPGVLSCFLCRRRESPTATWFPSLSSSSLPLHVWSEHRKPGWSFLHSPRVLLMDDNLLYRMIKQWLIYSTGLQTQSDEDSMGEKLGESIVLRHPPSHLEFRFLVLKLEILLAWSLRGFCRYGVEICGKILERRWELFTLSDP